MSAPLARLAPGFVLGCCLAAAAAAQYPVGTLDLTFHDAERGRSIPADVYYPATAAGGGQPVAEAPAGGFAVVSFGHGYQLDAGLYAWVGQDLAAAGFVVAVARTGGELFPDHAVFGQDLAFLPRVLRAAAEDPASPFFARIGTSAAVVGHSMGGGCSLLAAAGDPAVTAVAGFAPAETDPSAIAACATIGRPALLFAGTSDCVTPAATHQIPMYEALTGAWRVLVTVTGASHCQWAAYSLTCSFGELSCPSPTLTRSQQQDLTLTLLRPWLRAVLLDDGAAAQAFQDLLQAGGGFVHEQTGEPVTAAPIAPRDGALVLRASGRNPFGGRIELSLGGEAAGPVSLEVYDLAGRRIRTLPDVALAGGEARLAWDGRDDAGRPQPAGVYLLRARAAGEQASLRIMRLR